MKQSKVSSPILQFRLSVKNIKPEIWRLLVVSSDISLARLHTILQILMGWQDHHLYAYLINEKRYAPLDENDGNVRKSNPIRTKLSSIFVKKVDVITYEYDFGDGWEIELRTDSTHDIFKQKQPAECIEGFRHGPVEDSGGSRGYMEKVEIFGNPHHKRYHEIRKWMGQDFDPEAFDLAETNELLKEIG